MLFGEIQLKQPWLYTVLQKVECKETAHMSVLWSVKFFII